MRKTRTSTMSQGDWLLVFLAETPLDRLRLMKALFLFWHRQEKRLEGYFDFQPYLYGPFSFEMFGVLERLEAPGLVSRAPDEQPRYATYYLTRKGRQRAHEIGRRLDPDVLDDVRRTASEVSGLGFMDLLRRVYREAPEYASRTRVESALP
jgi:hypothetical protein